MSGALSGLTVIEFCEEMGDWAGKLLADMGANVIKIEPPGGSRTRTYEPFLDDEPGPERSLWWWHYNTNKKSVTLDINQTRLTLEARAPYRGTKTNSAAAIPAEA